MSGVESGDLEIAAYGEAGVWTCGDCIIATTGPVPLRQPHAGEAGLSKSHKNERTYMVQTA